MNVIEVNNISKKYYLGAFGTSSFIQSMKKISQGSSQREFIYALKDVSFAVEKGESLGIIGKNGSGKSTLLKILSRITSPTNGMVKIKGKISSLLEVGTGFHPDLTGKENIYLNGTIMGMKKEEIRKNLENIIDFSGVEKFINTPIKHYSSGMKVRLGFAIASYLKSDILIIDEVLAVGDVEFKNKCVKNMNNFTENGKTVIFVSHNMAQVKNICTRGILLDMGKNIFDGDVENTIRKYIEVNCVNLDDKKAEQKLDRRGTGGLRFEKVKIRNNKGIETNSIFSGDDIQVEFSYILHDKKLIGKKVEVSFVIKNLLGEQLLHFSNHISNGSLFLLRKKRGKFHCSIKRFPLVSGAYNFNIFCRVAGSIVDWVISCNKFNVIESDFYNTGENSDNNHGKFLIDYKWGLVD